MAALQRIEISGHRLVVLEEAEYERLCREAGREATEDSALPAFPESDTSGRFPALEYTRVQFARNLIGQRKALGLSQQQLADLAGVRPETVSRLESGRHTISGKTAQKLEHALAAEQKRRARRH
jgi:ribosome-binding protein aMBF1 (putative translation factor)